MSGSPAASKLVEHLAVFNSELVYMRALHDKLCIPIGSLVVPFLGLPYSILNMNHKKELLRSLWVLARCRY